MPSTTLSPTLLEVRHLSKRYGRVAALDDVSCSVRAGEIVGLIGPNGAGKTTLFECVAGLRPADRGDVLGGGVGVDLPLRRKLLFYLPDNAPGPGRNGAAPNPDLFPENNPVLRPPVGGRVGLWSKTDSTVLFKDYVITAK